METKLSIFVDGLHEYNYIKEETNTHYIHILNFSEASHWMDDMKGTLAFKIKEDKEDSKLSFSSVSSFSIAEAEYFDILLRLVLREESMPRTIEICRREAL